MQPKPAILLFSRSATAEAVAKYGGGNAQADALALALIRRTRHTVGRSGLPVYAFDERDQRGTTFGERLVNCVERVFAAGHAQVIIVGNDCPDLTVNHLHRAAALLDRGVQVLGRDGRGGVWLLGLRKTAFDAQALQSLRWQTAHLAGDLSEILRGAQELTLLHDVNGIQDLRRGWWRWKTRFVCLSVFLHRRVVPVGHARDWVSQSARTHLPGRAPPAAA